MAIRVTLECGHASMLRVQRTPLGYTHDWEVFVRGVDNADISQYVDKVVFHLHETFPKPKRILKEPPYIVKESGYAGFVIPIDVYLKNKDEPKRIQLSYDLHLQKDGPAINNVIRHQEVFVNPSEEFRKKLLKGGGITVSNPEDPAEKGEFKMVPPMISKPKLSGTDVKKHRMTDLRTSNTFADLFGNPMTLPAKVSPENKRSQSDKIVSSKGLPEKTEKIEKPAKVKHSPHKEKKKDKSVDDRKEKKDRSVVKEKDRVKDKSKRPPSPPNKEEFPYSTVKKSPLLSPPKNKLVPPLSSGIQKPTSPKPKEKEHKKMYIDKEKEKVKDNFKIPIEDRKFDRKKKKHKDDKSKDRKEKDKEKEHDKIKESIKKGDKKTMKPEKHEKSEKDKSLECKIPKDGKKSPKHSKEKDKSRIEKSDKNETIEKVKDSRTDKEKQKHKHKKKDKKERLEESTEKEKQEKLKVSSEKKGSHTASPTINPLSTLFAEMPERDSSDSTHSVDDDSMPSTKTFSTMKNESEIMSIPVLSSETSKPPLSPRGSVEMKNEGEERNKKDKSKVGRGEERDCRKRKRKIDGEQDEHAVKRSKERGHSESPSLEPVSSSQSPISIDIDSTYNFKETTALNNENSNIAEIEQVAPDSTNNSFIEPETDGTLIFSEDYVSQLKELQQKIMTLQDNQELQRVVQVIAETGQYEITRKTFDFDLCALDRRTVQRLQQFFSTS